MNVCPNVNLPEWKMMVKQLGSETEAYRAYMAHDYTIPPVVSELQLRRAIKMTGNNFSWDRRNMILRRLKAYNTSFNTSHSIRFEQVGEADMYKATIKFNYVPYNPNRRLAEELRRSEDGKVFMEEVGAYLREDSQQSELYEPNTFTPTRESERTLGYMNDEGDYLPYAQGPATRSENERQAIASEHDVDIIGEPMPEAEFDAPISIRKRKSGRFTELVSLKTQERNRLSSRMSAMRNDLRKRKDTMTPLEIDSMQKSIGELENRRSVIDRELAELSHLDALSDLEKFAKADFERLSVITQKRNTQGHSALTEEDIVWMAKTISLWQKAGDFGGSHGNIFWSDEEMEAAQAHGDKFSQGMAEMMAKFKSWQSSAESYRQILNDIYVDILNSVAKEVWGKESEYKLTQLRKDITAGKTWFLDISHVDNPVYQLMHRLGKDANLAAGQEARRIEETIDELVKKTGMTSFEAFSQTMDNEDGRLTGDLIDRYTRKYWAERQSLNEQRRLQIDRINASMATEEDKHKRRQKAHKNYYDAIKKMSMMVDYRLLYADDSLYVETDINGAPVTFSQEQIDAHRAEMIDAMGAEEFKRVEDAALRKIARYREDLKGMKLHYDAIHSDDQMASDMMLGAWIANNSPYVEAKMFYENAPMHNGFYVNPTSNYSMTVARKYLGDKDTGFYDEKYKAMRSDPARSELYDYIVDTMDELKNYLPAEKVNILHSNSLPYMQKDLIEKYVLDGVVAGMAPMTDKIVQSLRDEEQVVETPTDVFTGASDFKLQTQFIKNHEGEIKAHIQVRTLNYKLNTGSNPSKEALDEWRKEAIAAIATRKSMDVSRVVKNFAMMALTYKHKSRIDLVMNVGYNLARQEVRGTAQEIEEGKTTKDLKGKIADRPMGHSLEALELFMRHFYGYRTVDKSGARKWEEKNINKKTERLSTEDEKRRLREIEDALEANEEAREKGVITPEEYQENNNLLNEQWNSLTYRVSPEKMAMGLFSYFQLLNMGWNGFAGVANMGYGVISNFTEASDGRLFTNRQMLKAYGIVLNSIGGVNKFSPTAMKIRALMKEMDVLKDARYEIVNKKTRGTAIENVKRGTKVFQPFSPQSSTEYMNQAPVMVAILLNTKFDETHSMWDVLGNDGHLKPEFRTEKAIAEWENTDSNKKMRETKARIDEVIQFVHGNYDKLDSPFMASHYILGKFALQFKIWALMGFYSRFGGTVNYRNSSITRSGRYRSYDAATLSISMMLAGGAALGPIGGAVGYALGMIGGLAKQAFSGKPMAQNGILQDSLFMLGQYARRMMGMKTTFDENGYSELDSANMRRNMTEVQFLLALHVLGWILSYGLKHLDDDDEEYNSKEAFLASINILSRLATDVLFYSNPNEFEKLSKNLIPIMRMVFDGSNVVDAIQKTGRGDPTYKSGTYKGESRIKITSSRLVPFWKQWTRHRNILETRYNKQQWKVAD